MSTPEDDFLRRAVQGDSEALTQFTERVIPRLHRFVTRKCFELAIPRTNADDFIQETLLKAIRFINEQGRQPDASFRLTWGWLCKTSINLMRDWKRRNRAAFFNAASDEFLESIPSETEYERDRDRRCQEVLDYLDMMNPDEKELLEKVLIQHKSIIEAAREIDPEVTTDAAYKRYERATARLRDFLREHGNGWTRFTAD